MHSAELKMKLKWLQVAKLKMLFYNLQNHDPKCFFINLKQSSTLTSAFYLSIMFPLLLTLQLSHFICSLSSHACVFIPPIYPPFVPLPVVPLSSLYHLLFYFLNSALLLRIFHSLHPVFPVGGHEIGTLPLLGTRGVTDKQSFSLQDRALDK